jgi:hypothetical protein
MSHTLWAGKQEKDQITTGPVFVIAAIIVSIMILTYIAVRHYTDSAVVSNKTALKTPVLHEASIKMNTNGEPLVNVQIPQFGMLHQTLFDTVSDAKDLKAFCEDRLESYGWVEQGKVAHIPIERAMELTIQQRAQGK